MYEKLKTSLTFALNTIVLAAVGLSACDTPRAKAHGELVSQPLAIKRPTAAVRAAEPGNPPIVQIADLPLAEPSSTNGCPAEMARVRNFCVDRYEAVLVEACSDGGMTEHPSHLAPVDGVRYEARSKAGVRPQGYISQVQSAAACENAGKRLCSALEWYTTCRGSKKQTYPYGSSYVRGKCNSGKPHLLGRLYGNNAHRWTYENFNNPVLNKEPGFLEPTGERTECTNDFGAYDMVGNLHEWVSDSVSPSLANDIQLVDGVRRALYRNGGHGVFMGGFFSTTAEQGPGCDFTTVGHEPRYHDYSTGFRCCKDAEL